MRMRRDVRVPAVRSMGMNSCVCVYESSNSNRNANGIRSICQLTKPLGGFIYLDKVSVCRCGDLGSTLACALFLFTSLWEPF